LRLVFIIGLFEFLKNMDTRGFSAADLPTPVCVS